MYYEVNIDLQFTDATVTRVTISPISSDNTQVIEALKANIMQFKYNVKGTEAWYNYIVNEKGAPLMIENAIASAELIAIDENYIIGG